MNTFFALLGAYLLGAIPFALVIGKGLCGTDVREHGSGNLGTTNTIRVLGVKMGVLVLLGDLGKGWVAAWLGSLVGGPTLGVIAGMVAVAGHCYPVFAGFKGGKGVATGGGAFLQVMPLPFWIGISTFAAVLLIGRYVSVASLSAAAAIGVSATLLGYRGAVLAITWAVIAFVYYTHRSNIKRLLRGEESRVRFKWNRRD